MWKRSVGEMTNEIIYRTGSAITSLENDRDQALLEKSDPKKSGDPSVVPSDPKPSYKVEIVWQYVAVFVGLHLGALYGLYLLPQAKWQTLMFTFVLYLANGLGITAGAHRLWSHKCYKATLPLQIMLMIFNCVACQDTVIRWSRDHRVHHKFTETDADPYNAKRGFFFSHCGWLLVKKHPSVAECGKKLDLSDLEQDPVLKFQKKHYTLLALAFGFILPAIIPWIFWGEDISTAYFVCGLFRLIACMHVTWTVNSLAHLWGSRPYDTNVYARQNIVSIVVSMGEGFHNYHHVFPWDYRASEYGMRLNTATAFINLMSKIGWAYDTKIVDAEVIRKKKAKTGESCDNLKLKYVLG